MSKSSQNDHQQNSFQENTALIKIVPRGALYHYQREACQTDSEESFP